jgi:general secretion pathway protein I
MTRPRNASQRRSRGFTLIEVLVALGIFGMAMVALIHMQGESARAAAALRDRTLAGVVAQNALVDLYTRADPLPNGPVGGTVQLAGASWTWSGQIAVASNAVRRLDVNVRLQGDETVLGSVSAFKRAP